MNTYIIKSMEKNYKPFYLGKFSKIDFLIYLYVENKGKRSLSWEESPQKKIKTSIRLAVKIWNTQELWLQKN